MVFQKCSCSTIAETSRCTVPPCRTTAMVFSPLALRHCHPYLLPSRATRAKKQRARDRQSLVTSQRWSAFHATARPGRLGVEYYTVTIDATFHLFSVVPFKFYHWLLRTCLTHTSRGGVKRCQSCCVVCLPCTRPQSPASSHLKPDGPSQFCFSLRVMVSHFYTVG
jgi:hypothetical protein